MRQVEFKIPEYVNKVGPKDWAHLEVIKILGGKEYRVNTGVKKYEIRRSMGRSLEVSRYMDKGVITVQARGFLKNYAYRLLTARFNGFI